MHDVARTVGRYEIVREVGRGGMAIVYLARQTDLERDVALKELAAFHQSDLSFARRFVRESKLIASLSHPNIVTVHDYFEHDGIPYIAMEYLARGSLRPYVTNLTLPQTVGVLEGVLAGLAHAETRGIVHRDLKPENLMVTSDGRVKITDFGIAKAKSGMGNSAMLTATGMTVGTPTYMAPEQAMAREIGPWTDLYSVGCIVYEILCGQPPFTEGDTPLAILLQHVNQPLRPPRSVNQSLDPALSDWIERLVVKDPQGRTASATDAWDELEEIVIDVLGPRWRRDARLVDRDVLVDTPRPLTPAPFASTHTRTPTPGSHPSAPPPVAEESVDVGGQPQDQEYEEASDLETPAAPSADETEAPTEEPRVEAAPEAPPTPAAESSIEPPAERSEFVTFARSAREPVEELPQPEPAAPASQPATPVPVPVPVSPPDDALARTVEPKAPPPPPAPPPPHRAPSDPSRVPARRRRAALLVGIAVLFAVVGFVVAPSKTQKQRALPPLSHTATSTAFSLAYPEHLTLVHESVNLGLADPMALASSEDPSKIIAAGRMAAVGPSLLPHGLRAQLSESPVPDRIRLSALQALRYNNLRPAGSSLSLRVYAVPTSAGVVGIVCSAPPGASGSFASECERIAQTLKLRSGARGFPVGPSASYAAALGKATKLLAVERQPALKRLSAARTPRRQARDARAVASAYAGVAGILGGLKLSPYDAGANNALVAALTGARRSYSRLAEAAKASDHPGYRDAKRAVARAERAVIGTIPTFTALGYEVKQ